MQLQIVGICLVVGSMAAWCGEEDIPIDALPAVIGSDKVDAVDLSVAMEERAMEHDEFLAQETSVPEYREIYRLLAEYEKKHRDIVASWKSDMLFRPGMTKEALNQILTYVTVFSEDSLETITKGNADTAVLGQLIKEYLFETQIRDLHLADLQSAKPEYRVVYSGMVREETNDIKLLQRLIEIARKPRHDLTKQEYSDLEQIIDK